MNTDKAIKNASWVILIKIIQSVITLIISIITARYFGPANFGLLNYAASIVAFALPIMQLGLQSIVVRELISKPKKEGETLGTCIVLNLICSILSIIGIFIFVSVMNFGEIDTIIVTMLYSLSLIAQGFEIISYWFQAKLISKYTVVVNLIVYILIAIYKIFLLATNKDVKWFAISNMLDYMIINIILIFMYFKLGGQKFSFSLSRAKEMLNISKYFIISGIMITIFSQTDKIMLKLMINEEATGIYSAAIYCAGMTSFIFAAIINSAKPLIFESKNKNQELFKKYITILYAIVIYLALLQSIVISLFAKPIIMIMYGKEFIDAIPVLSLVVWYTTFSYIGAIRNTWLLAEKKQNLICRVDILGAFLNVVLNLILIPKFKIMGAALASLITQIFTNVILGFILKDIRENNFLMIRSLNIKNIKGIIFKILNIIKNKMKFKE